jgi:hypothetical protein
VARRRRFRCRSPTSTGPCPRVPMRVVCVRHAALLRPFPLAATCSPAPGGRHPHEDCGRPATSHSPGLAPSPARGPPPHVGRFPWRALCRRGPWRMRPGVVPRTPHRAPWPPVTGVPCSLGLDAPTCRRRRFPSIPHRSWWVPTRHGVKPGVPMTPDPSACRLRTVRALESLCSASRAGSLSGKRGSDRRTCPRRMQPASGGCALSRFRQAQPLGDLPAPPCAFQGHAAHAGERPHTRSPTDGSASWDN